jgi:hypothetical protein
MAVVFGGGDASGGEAEGAGDWDDEGRDGRDREGAVAEATVCRREDSKIFGMGG